MISWFRTEQLSFLQNCQGEGLPIIGVLPIYATEPVVLGIAKLYGL
jgi:hypothetical protein